MKYFVFLVGLLIIFSCSKTPSDIPVGQYSSIIEYKDIIIDGIVDDDWESSYENNHISSWGTLNNFNNLYIARDEDNLYIAIEGGFFDRLGDDGNVVNIYIDTEYNSAAGITDISSIYGEGTFSDYGNQLRKNISVPNEFRLDIAFTCWGGNNPAIVVIDQNSSIESTISSSISINPEHTVIEFSIPFLSIYENGVIPLGEKIALVAIISDDQMGSFADDAIPQPDGGFTGNFTTVISSSY